MEMTRVLVVGLPRSGTTWISRVLSAPSGVGLVHEPDNQWAVPYAHQVKRELRGRWYPRLRPGDCATGLENLWRHAFGLETQAPGWQRALRWCRRAAAHRPFISALRRGDQQRAVLQGGKISPRLALAEALAVPISAPDRSSLVVKSVFSALSVEWIAYKWPVNVLVVMRGSYNVLSSWDRLWPASPDEAMLDLDSDTVTRLSETAGIPVPANSSSWMARSACLYGLLMSELMSAAQRHPEWHLVWHESLAAEPREQLRDVAERVGLPWTSDSERALEQMNRPGVGTPDAWRGRLTPSQIEAIDSVLHGRFSGPPEGSGTLPVTGASWSRLRS
jgi:Sulfotransferase family